MFARPDPGGAAPGATTPPPPPPPPPVAPTGGGSSTTTPTFPGIPGILANDPMYQQLLSFDQAASAGDLASLNKKVSQMQAYYGSDTDPLSLLGRVYQSYQDRNRTIANTLGAHGMINSGETGFQAARATLAYQQQEYDAKFKLDQYIQGLHDALNASQQARQQNEITAAGNAISSYLQLNPPTVGGDGGGGDYSQPPVPPAPTAPAATSFQWGNQTWTKGDKLAFTQYLNSKGVKYSDWAAAHPSAAALL